VLEELLPAMARLDILGNVANPATQFSWKETQLAAHAVGLEPALFTVRRPNELPAAFAAMQRNGVDAVVVLAEPRQSSHDGKSRRSRSSINCRRFTKRESSCKTAG
jgi:ABC-type uncharacterized transport system substrate-binding protein